MRILAIFLSIVASQCFSQEWVSIETPVTTNLILFDMSFSSGQDSVGYSGGANQTFNGLGTIMKSEDTGSTWEVIWTSATAGSGVTALHFINTEVGMAGTMDGSMMTTSDGGATWAEVDIAPGVDQGEIRDIEFYDDQSGVLLTAWEGVYTTTDGGDNWTQASTNALGALYVAYADANNLFATGGEQRIYRSQDAGLNWNQVFQGPNASMQWLNVGVGFFDADNGMVSSEEGQIFITADGGDSWTVGQIPNQFGFMRGVHYTTSEEIYVAATPGAVYKSEDAGTTWAFDSPVDFDPSYYQVLFTDNGTGLVCGSASTGGTILRKNPPVIIVDGVSEYAVQPLILSPNPASDWIRLTADADLSGADLSVFDSLGKMVLSSTVLGDRFDVSSLSNGLYTLSVLDGEGMRFAQELLIRR